VETECKHRNTARRRTISSSSGNSESHNKVGIQSGTIFLIALGTRTDLSSVAEAVKQGCNKRQIAAEFPESFIKYHRGISELMKVLNPQYETTEFTEKRYDLEIDWSKTQVFTGPAGCGKTVYALQLIPKALFCTHLDDLARFNTEDYNGIIFDEASFKHMPREAQIHLCDQDQDRSLHVRYVCARIPKHTKKIFTTNLPVWEILNDDPAIMRRIQIHEF